MKKKIMNVAMATSQDYQYMYVAIYSILENMSSGYTCHFHILAPENFENESEHLLMDLCEKKGCTLKVYRIGARFKDAVSHVSWIAPSTYYRLIIADLLKEEEKCLYIDCDVVVMGDISELYFEDISNYMVGGVFALAYHKFLDEDYCQKSGIPSLNQYINAGVLLMNLGKMRENNFVEEAMELIPKNLPSQDQDIVNRLCYGSIRILPFRNNAMTKYFNWKNEDYEPLYKADEIMEAWKNPLIIHYADQHKPWNNFSVPLASYWWFFCVRSKMRNYWMERASSEFMYRVFYDRNFKEGIKFRRDEQYKDSILERLIIFGAGKKAEETIPNLLNRKIKIEYIIVSDVTNNPSSLFGITVKQVDMLEKKYCKIPVVLAVSEMYEFEIIETLWRQGFYKIIMRNELESHVID